MKALTLCPHWAWLVVNGYKDIENRSSPTRLRGRIWIHASSRRVTRDEYDQFFQVCSERRIKKFPQREGFQIGGIIGSVEIVDCVTRSPSYWFIGDYGFVLANAQKATFRPMKGKLGFFEVDGAPPSRRKLAGKRTVPLVVGNDFVAYHSTDLMGYEYAPTRGRFSFFSRKALTFLEKSIGGNVWAITGTRDSEGKLIYRLVACYTPDEVKKASDAFEVIGKNGHIFKDSIELNGFPWFQKLLREQNRFSFGFSRIQSPDAIAALHRIAHVQSLVGR
jgi:hypothetical protein